MDADDKSGKQREDAAVSGRSGLSHPDTTVDLVPETGRDLYVCTRKGLDMHLYGCILV